MVSPRKSTSALSVVPEEHGTFTPISRKSYESIYSAASSRCSAAYRCKIAGNRPGVMGGYRQAGLIPATSEVRQRVLSARRLRIKGYQNQLADAHNRIAELSAELRLLSTLHKRQHIALAKYEASNAELPQLLHSHAEELRMWQSRYRSLQTAHRELESRLKQKESVILTLSDQNKYFSQLNKEKGLEERQRLTEKVAALETRLQEKDNDMKLMARKMQLEIRNYKQQLANEQKKTKDALSKLEKLHFELSSYRKLAEVTMGDKIQALSTSKLSMNHLRGFKLKAAEKARAHNELLSAGFPDIHSNSSSPMSSPRLESARKAAIAQESSQRADVGKVCENSASPISVGKNYLSLAANPPSSPKEFYSDSSAKTVERLNIHAKGESAKKAICSLPSGRAEDAGVTKQSDQRKPKVSEIVLEEKTEIIYHSEGSYEDDEYDGDDLVEESDENHTGESRTLEVTQLSAAGSDGDFLLPDQKPNMHSTTTTTTTVSRRIEVYENNDCKQLLSPKIPSQSPSKGDMSSIRKQISDDYKEREAFLDIFCRQATSTAASEGTGTQKRNSIAIGDNSTKSSRRNRLLAALKAIDDDPSQGQRN